MTPTTRFITILALLGLIPLQGAVAAAYKWVDDKGETHYSQTPPPVSTKAQVIKTPSSAGSVAAPPAATPASAGTDSADTDAAKTEDASIRAKNCTIARTNLDALNGAGEVNIKDKNGLLHRLTPDERKARREQAENAIKEYCKE